MFTATAHSNIALVKYWGKRDAALNLPAAGSLSFTLAALTTTTSVRLIDGPTDRVELDRAPVDGARVSPFLDLVRSRAGSDVRAEVVTANDFPTAAGLASSASGFAALALAAARAYGLELSEAQLSVLARRGSGSAARSISGGFCEMRAGIRPDGADAFAEQLAGPDHWDLRCVVLLTAEGAKAVGSTDGMHHTARSSPYYQAWVDSVPPDLDAARAAVLARDFERLAVVAERSCLRMHASAIASDPGVLYWNARTVELVHRVRAARAAGHAAFFTIDAGPHVKVFCTPDAVPAVLDLAGDVAGEPIVSGPIVSGPGGPARLVEA